MNTFYLGSDVSKGYADFIILSANKQMVEDDFRLDDTHTGHQQLFAFFEEFFAKYPNSVVFAAVESTGGYENNWYNTLKSIGNSLPVKTARLNPRGIWHHNKASLKRVTTDKISAFTIAEYQINYPDKIYYDQKEQYKSMKRLFKSFRMLAKVKTQLLNQLESLLYTANTELVQYRKNNTPKWLLYLLVDYPIAADLAQASAKELAKIPYINLDRANELIEAAKSSVASATDIPTQVTIKVLVNQILELDKSIMSLKKEAEKFVDMSEIKLLTSIPSIGTMSAIGLFIELDGCISRFQNAKKLASFWGLNPKFKESGDGSSACRMSKEGRIMPRSILFMTVLNGIRTDSFIKRIYERELKKGKSKMSAIGVCMHKMARIVFGVLKNNTLFDPNIDIANQQKSKPKKKKSEKKPLVRRYQDEDPVAPISRKQNKKRKERELSQSEPVAVCEINVPAP